MQGASCRVRGVWQQDPVVLYILTALVTHLSSSTNYVFNSQVFQKLCTQASHAVLL